MDDAPREAARRVVDGGPAALAAALADTEAQALGWALKAECYEAWNTTPPRARVAAACLDALASRHPGDPELRALADWTAGIGALTEGRMGDALASLQRAQAGFVALARDDWAAQTQVPQLMALAILGRHDEALRCGEEALARFVASGDERAAGKIELNLGNLLSRQDRHAEAVQWFRRAAPRFARAGDAELSIMADIALANSLAWSFEFEEALLMSERARMRADGRGYGVLAALAHGSIGRVELHRGNVDRALSAMAVSCRRLEESGASPQRLAEAEAALADAYRSVQLLPEAVALYQRVIERCRTTDADIELAWASLCQAETQARMGSIDLAREGLQRARELYRDQGNVAAASIAALRLAALGDDADEGGAEAALFLALAAEFERCDFRGWQYEAQMLAAAATARRGDLAVARSQYLKTLQQSHDLVSIQLACLTGLGLLERRAGRAADAIGWLERAVALIESQRAALPGDEFRTAFAADKQVAYDALVDLAADDAAEGAAERLWLRMEAGRSRALQLGIGRREADAPATDTDAMRTRLHWLRDEERRALAAGQTTSAAALARRAESLEQEALEALRREQLGRAPRLPIAEAVDASDIGLRRPTLRGDQAIVAYHLDDDRLTACVLDGEGVTRHRWVVPGLAERLDGLRFQMDSLRGGAAGLARHADQLLARVRAHLQALYRLCWQPLAARLGARRQVIVLPHRRLHYLPFAALHDGEAWLVDRHDIVLSPSAAIWQEAGRRPDGPCERALAVGVGGPTLPHVQREVDAVAAVFGAGATTLRDAEATIAALRGAVDGADVVHLACHGQFRADNPHFSSLALADGALTLRDAAALPLTARLVTLSACETALSRIAPGEELIGLVRGFLLAGVPSVVASHWTVDDASTAALMARFYAGLRGGQGPAAALAGTQRTMARRGAHPFYWAAFAVHGRG